MVTRAEVIRLATERNVRLDPARITAIVAGINDGSRTIQSVTRDITWVSNQLARNPDMVEQNGHRQIVTEEDLLEEEDETSGMSQQTAASVVTNMLRDYGLTFDEQVVNRWVGLLSDDPQNSGLIEEEIRQSDVFKQRFPGLKARTDNGLNALSVQEYLTLEDQYKTIFRNADMPPSFFDQPADLAQFIAADVSPAELESRVIDGVVAAQNAPAEVVDALESMYGVPRTNLAAYFLDPDRGLEAIQRQFETATIGAQAEVTGFGEIDREQAERLRALGISDREARGGFSALSSQRGLLSRNLFHGEEFSENEQMQAQFEQNAGVLARIRRQRNARRAAFDTNVGGAIVTNRGVAGLSGNDNTG